jgi:hypothetical protein
MSAYRIAQSIREVHIMGAGSMRGQRTLLINLARSAEAGLRRVYANAARAANHNMVRDLRAARAAIATSSREGM